MNISYHEVGQSSISRTYLHHYQGTAPTTHAMTQTKDPCQLSILKKKEGSENFWGGKGPQYLLHHVSWATHLKATETGILNLHYVAILQ